MRRITNEQEWLACEDPYELGRYSRSRSDTHRFRWLAEDWGRRIRHIFEPEDLTWFDAFALWVAGTGDHPARVCQQREYCPLDNPLPHLRSARACAEWLRRDDSLNAAVSAGRSASEDFPWTDPTPVDYSKSHRGRAKHKRQREEAGLDAHHNAWWAARDEHRRKVGRQFCDEFRDVAGNPFRPVTLQPGWQTSVVTGLARAIDENRGFDQLPILADALEEAGCDNAEVLQHCRGPGPHVRGCWVIGLLLGRL